MRKTFCRIFLKMETTIVNYYFSLYVWAILHFRLVSFLFSFLFAIFLSWALRTPSVQAYEMVTQANFPDLTPGQLLFAFALHDFIDIHLGPASGDVAGEANNFMHELINYWLKGLVMTPDNATYISSAIFEYQKVHPNTFIILPFEYISEITGEVQHLKHTLVALENGKIIKPYVPEIYHIEPHLKKIELPPIRINVDSLLSEKLPPHHIRGK